MDKRKVICTAIMIFSALVVLCGILLLLFPIIDNQVYINRQNKIIDEYNQQFFNNSGGKSHKDKNAPDLERLYKDIRKYNKRIYKENQYKLEDKSSYQAVSLNLYDYGFKNEVYGYITINKINVNMAIYLGASDYNMSQGAAHLSQTSIPLGGKNTNAVLAGHCGYGGRQMFRYVENLTEGDLVTITTPFGKLNYRVAGREIIEPNNLEKIKIKDNKDMITLFTCYPYPTNRYRCCVFCKREKI